MQKLFLSLLFIITFIIQGNAQQRLFDQQVQLKNCSISIETNPFVATTVVEMEFYNPRNQEVEAYQAFELNNGQVITDFQLELNGKYREGSIEERWKARTAYSSIVGKRIDPALLQMNGRNRYSINIYPVAAKSSRKIKFTIIQMMKEENLKLSYVFPLNFKTITDNFNLSIKVNRPASIPYADTGFLQGQLFSMHNEEALFSMHLKELVLNKEISFSINQFANQPQFCINKKNGTTNFLMRFYPDMPQYYPAKPESIKVYWDVSLSGKQRNLSKELDFLETYISINEINRATVFLFNHEMRGIIEFDRSKNNIKSIRNYLLTYNYTGATDLGILNFSNVLADAVLVFSDGINSTGNARPKRGAVPVNFVTSSYAYYSNPYANLASTAGGSVISLYYTDVEKAIKKTEWSENYLFKYTASSIRINESFPVKLGGSILLSGTLDKGDNLELFYGNNKLTAKSVNYFLPAEANCDDATYKKMQLLKAYDSIMQGYFNYNYNYNWQNMLIFGLTEKVVTPQTSYLVLERIEDYIKYKIAPPKELEEQCAELNYVYKPEYKIKALKEFTEQDALAEVVKDFNKRINWWSHNEPLVDLKRPAPDLKNTADAVKPADGQQKGYAVQTNTVMQTNFSTGTAGNLQEVVVTSAFGIKRTARSTASSVQNLSGEQVNTIRQININNALAGKVAGAQVRSQSIAKLGAETRIRLRGENGFGVGAGAIYVVDGNIMAEGADINPDDVEDYSVLQGPAAAALFGPDGSNGAIVMTTKKARRGYPRQYLVWSEYKLSSCEDEYYLQEMKNAADYELLEIYQKLENQNEMDVGFYFEMANFFFEKGKTDKAQELMYNAIELCRGTTEGLKLAAYLYEKWKWFDKAIAVYKGILSSNENNLLVKRDLALAYFQHKEFDAAVKTYYSIITAADENGHYGYIKENALMEMNTILLLHKNEFDVSYINPNLIKVLPVDLRISVESNYPSSANTQIIEPGNVICNDKNLLTVNGGRFTGKDNDNISYGLSEYSIKDAVKGRYRIKVDARNYYSFASTVPMYVRVIAFKNFQQANMEMEIKIFDLDNQYGVVELDDVKW